MAESGHLVREEGVGEGHLHLTIRSSINLQDSSFVANIAAVVGCTEDSQNVLFVGPSESFHLQSVRATDQVQAISLVELAGDVLGASIQKRPPVG